MVCEHSPDWLIEASYNDLPILMTKNHIENALGIGRKGNQHAINKKVLSNLPFLLEKPFAVFNYKGADLLVILKAVDNYGKIIVAAIKPNGIGNYNDAEIDSNFLLSIYGRNEIIRFFDKVLNNANIIYLGEAINKKEVLQAVLKCQTFGNDRFATPWLQLTDHC